MTMMNDALALLSVCSYWLVFGNYFVQFIRIRRNKRKTSGITNFIEHKSKCVTLLGNLNDILKRNFKKKAEHASAD